MTEKLLTPKEAAQYCRVSVKIIYDWKFKGIIPYCKLHGKLLFPVESLYAWVRSKYQNSTTCLGDVGRKNQAVSDPEPLLESLTADVPPSARKKEALWQSKK
jgi:excisionase family DNA binding protein